MPDGKLAELPASVYPKAFSRLLVGLPMATSTFFPSATGGNHEYSTPGRARRIEASSSGRGPPGTYRRGDNRINSFGIVGTVEVRTSRLVQKLPVTGPEVHVGIGEAKEAQVVRVDWPNGTFQVEFEADPAKPVVAVQRLKGSCPFLFANDGDRVKFVTDFLWSTPLGMYINGQDKGGFLQTTDWVKVRSDQLAERDGFYDLRVNANLWETHYIDYVSTTEGGGPPAGDRGLRRRTALFVRMPPMVGAGARHRPAEAGRLRPG